jgi:glutamate racemase
MTHRALIFDSGVGGLSVAAEIRKALPDLKLDYVADDEFRPYGNKTAEQLQARLPALLKTLSLMLRPDIIVIACNTASTSALAHIRRSVDVPVVGVVPAVKPAALATRTGTLAVLGTPGTIAQPYVDELISDFAGGKHVILQGSLTLVDIAEAKLSGKAVDHARLKAELAPLFLGRRGADIDAVVLACTHFPLLREELRAAAPQTVQWIDSGPAIARRVSAILKNLGEAKARAAYPQTAFLIGPDTSAARKAAFGQFGFTKVAALNP